MALWLRGFVVSRFAPELAGSYRQSLLYRGGGVSARALASPAASQPAAEEDEPANTQGRAYWTPGSRRTGAIAVKLGMTQMWDAQGDPVPVTVLQVRIPT